MKTPPGKAARKSTREQSTTYQLATRKSIAFSSEVREVNVLKGIKFVPLPRELFDSGALRDLSGGATKLCLCLYYLAYKHSAVELEPTNEKCGALTGLHHSTLSIARDELVEAGFIKYSRVDRQIVRYILLNPETREPIPAPEGKKGILRHQTVPSKTSRSAVTPMSAPIAIEWNEIGGEVGVRKGESTFGKSASTVRKIRRYPSENPNLDTTQDFEIAQVNEGASSLEQSLEEGISRKATFEKKLCRACKRTEWGKRADGSEICLRCHPK